MPEAKGIPDREYYGDLNSLQPNSLIDFVRQLHLANVAGKHEDWRLGTPESGMFSWAVRKGEPEPGKKHLAVQQPLHSPEYNTFEGNIPKGYGAGDVKRLELGKALLTSASPDKLSFTAASRGIPARFSLIKTNPLNWLLLNNTLNKSLNLTKEKYKDVKPGNLEQTLEKLPEDSIVQKKIDGALSYILLNKHPEILSHRTHKETGNPIVHTERVFRSRPSYQLPTNLKDTILKAELYGTKNNKTISPNELSGILNSTVENALNKQDRDNIDLKALVFDIARKGKKNIGLDTPYEDRYKEITDILSKIKEPKFSLPENYKKEEAKELFNKIISGKDPSTREGIVIHPPTGKPIKVKGKEEHDVFLRSTFPGEGKYSGKGIGGFLYSFTPNGPIAGKVGTGLNDEMRSDAYNNPDKYIGRIARLHAQEQHNSGALRAPSLIALHESL